LIGYAGNDSLVGVDGDDGCLVQFVGDTLTRAGAWCSGILTSLIRIDGLALLNFTGGKGDKILVDSVFFQ